MYKMFANHTFSLILHSETADFCTMKTKIKKRILQNIKMKNDLYALMFYFKIKTLYLNLRENVRQTTIGNIYF